MIKKNYPHILLIGNFLGWTGINPTYKESLAVKLEESGVSLATASSVVSPYLRWFDMIFSVINAKKRDSIVIVDIYSGPKAFIFGSSISFLCQRLNLRYIPHLCGGNLPNISKKRKQTLNRILSGASIIIAPSQYLASQFKDFQGIRIIPNAIDVNSYFYRDFLEIRPNLLFLRSFHKLTRPQDAIICTSKLLSNFPNTKLALAGWNEDGTLEECQELVRQLKLDEYVCFLGKLSKQEIYGLSKNYDIFLHTMLIDNTPVTLLEAMALGLCIVATNVGGIPYLIKDGENGLLVSPQKPEDMAEAVKRYLLDWEFARRIRKNARILVENYSWEKIIPMWLELIQEI